MGGQRCPLSRWHAHFTVVTDSNPVVPVLNDRRLDQVTNDRLLKLKTLLARYNFTARWQAGKHHLIKYCHVPGGSEA